MMPQAWPGFGKRTSTSTSSMPASAQSASACSRASFSTSGSHTAKPNVDDHAARFPCSCAAALPDTTACSYERAGRGSDVGSMSVGPAIASMYRAASRTDRHIGPGTDVSPLSNAAWLPTRPKLTLKPKSPEYDDGMRIDPPPSLPVQIGIMPAETAAAEPPDEPPGVRSGFQGLRVVPWRYVRVQFTEPNSGDVVSPTNTAPAARSRATSVQSRSATSCSNTRDACVFGQPRTCASSLTPIGTPAHGPGSSPLAIVASMPAACACAESTSRNANALSSGSSSSTRTRNASSTSDDFNSPARMASASCHASLSHIFVLTTPPSRARSSPTRRTRRRCRRPELRDRRTCHGRPTGQSASCRRTRGCPRQP